MEKFRVMAVDIPRVSVMVVMMDYIGVPLRAVK